jgi:plasmid stabilization system protein ParE
MEGKVEKIIVVSEYAKIDLEQEYFYYGLHYGIEKAEKLRNGFNAAAASILPNPYIFPECRFLPTKTQIYRNIIWGNYLIVYRIKKNVIEVPGLFHSKRNPSKIRLAKKRK